VKADRNQVQRALKGPAATRLFLFHGADEAGSRALARRIGEGLGPGAERVVLTGSELRSDPARLADEAASLSMFGSGRYIIVEPVGDESVEAVTALLDAEAAGNPVALVAGTLKATSKLLKLCLSHQRALAFQSYLPEPRDWDRLVTEMARPLGLTARPDVARRIAEAASGNRAVIEQELAKYALYLRADPGRPAQIEFEHVEAIGAAREEGDTYKLIDQLFDGDAGGAAGEIARLRSEGSEGITLIRAALRRALLLAKLRGRVEQGESASGVVASQGKALFFKDRDGVARQLAQWPAERLERCLSRLLRAEDDVKNAGIGTIAADAELLAIARQARRR
jgi:DNA polymerase III subunit delta